MRRLAPLLLLTLALPAFAAAPVTGSGGPRPQAAPSVEDRLQLLERRMQALTDILISLERLQQEVQDLRGDLELQNHSLETLKKRQRDLYVDIDRRITQLTSPPPAAAPPAVGGSAPSPVAAPAGGTPVAPPDTAAGGPSPAPPPAVAPPVPATASPAPATGAPLAETPATPAGAIPDEASPPADPAQEQPMYKQAFDLLMQRRYDEAKQAFRLFLARYPKGRLAANAQYWVGEASYVTRDFATALADFSKVVQDFPASPKVADALLKMGFIRYEQQEWAQARKTLETVVERYPSSTAARLARKRLERMRIEGN
ncbi:MAG TPA: tol-pal system protein YbgF [Sedimenticola sp.]|nr:tol-pal system protein YbgF [Sedimenticola sp.]